MTTFVLLHGAWHGGWCWDRVTSGLRARGHRVTTPTQTGLGERRHLLSADLDLGTFRDDLVNHILFDDLTDIVLVGHSFGGSAISAAAEVIPDRIAQLIYLDSTILGPGERLIDQKSPEQAAERMRAFAASPDGMSIAPPAPSVFGVLDPADAAWLGARLTPHPINTMLSPNPLTRPPGEGLPVRYIACTDPIYHAPERVRAWASQLGCSAEAFASGHDAMVIDPAGLLEVLDR